MYFSHAPLKILGIAALAIVLIALALGTYDYKEAQYGQSKWTEIIARTIGGEVNAFGYSLRSLVGLSGVSYERNRDGSETARAIPVLTYHAIVSDNDKENVSPESFEGHNVGQREFEDQMFTLKRNGWHTVTLEEFDAFMREGKSLPAKSFLLTFDDGAKESYYPVDPLLKVLGYSAVSFILPAYSSGEGTHYYLSKAEIGRALASGRWEIGSHGEDIHRFVQTDDASSSAPALANRAWLPAEGRLETVDEYETRVKDDLVTAKVQLSNIFGRPITAFAFPFGDYGQLTSNVPNASDFLKAASAGVYDYTFYQWYKGEGYTYNYPDMRGSMVKRISVHPDWSGAELLALLENGLPKNLPYEDDFSSDQGWLDSWGTHEVKDGTLTLRAVGGEAGASAILDGTGDWRDYDAHITVASAKNTGAFVFVRFKGNDDYADCNIGNGFAHVEQMVGGDFRVIKGNRSGAIVIPEGPFTVDVHVRGREVTCGINGTTLVDSTFLDESLDRGGIGFKAWDKVPNIATLVLDTLSVSRSTE